LKADPGDRVGRTANDDGTDRLAGSGRTADLTAAGGNLLWPLPLVSGGAPAGAWRAISSASVAKNRIQCAGVTLGLAVGLARSGIGLAVALAPGPGVGVPLIALPSGPVVCPGAGTSSKKTIPK
jgi:hypothetical protein